MVRTKSSGGRKAVAEKAPRKVLASSSGSSGAGSSRSGATPKGKGKYAGGAPACPRPTPEWQKGITNFFTKSPKVQTEEEDGEMAGGSADPDKEIIEDHKENVDANIEESGASSSGSSGSSSTQFKKNGIISDSEDED